MQDVWGQVDSLNPEEEATTERREWLRPTWVPAGPKHNSISEITVHRSVR